MADEKKGLESHTKLFGHAAHQIMIVFPLGLLSTATLFDVAALLTKKKETAAAATSMLAAGLVGGAVAAPLGYNDWRYIPQGTRAREVGRWHGLGNVLVMALYGWSWAQRRGKDTVPAGAVTLSLLGSGLALLTGWLGGELVDRLGVGLDDGAHLNAPSSLSGRPADEEA